MTASEKLFLFRKKTKWLPTILITIWTIGLISMIGVIAYGLITTPSRIDDLIFILFVMVLMSLIELNYISWQINGQEIVIFTEHQIEIKKIGKLFKTKTQLKYYEIEKFEYDNDYKNPIWRKFWGLEKGKFKLKYLETYLRIGHDLNSKNEKNCLDQLNHELEKREITATNNV